MIHNYNNTDPQGTSRSFNQGRSFISVNVFPQFWAKPKEAIEPTERGQAIDFLESKINLTEAPVLCFKLWPGLAAGISMAS